jgi:hypothetical protein
MKDLSGDGKITKKDVLIGRGVIAKKEDGGPVTSRKLTRLGTKIEKKTIAGKTVGKGLQKRYDKAVDKVIVKGMTKKK